MEGNGSKSDAERMNNSPTLRLRRVLEALEVVNRLHPLGDAVYAVRDRAAGDAAHVGNSWDHPDVKSYSDAVGVLQVELTRGAG